MKNLICTATATKVINFETNHKVKFKRSYVMIPQQKNIGKEKKLHTLADYMGGGWNYSEKRKQEIKIQLFQELREKTKLERANIYAVTGVLKVLSSLEKFENTSGKPFKIKSKNITLPRITAFVK